MTALKNFLAVTFLTLLICASNVDAADKPRVMLMDLRIFADSSVGDKNVGISIDSAEIFMIKALVNNGNFRVMERDVALIQEEFAELFPEIKNADLPDSAKEVDYLIYSDNFIEVIRKGENFRSAKCTTILYLLDAKTERLITAVKGEGISERSEVKKTGFSSQDILQALGIENATRRAAKDAVDKLIKNFPE